jgi:Caudovirus prohead serine protease
MPYPTNESLPQAVKDKIKSPKRRRQWRHVWNSEYASHGDEGRAFASAWSTAQKGLTVMPETTTSGEFKFFLPITKIDRERRLISGYASTPALDMDGEIVALDAVKKALPGYWQWRNIRRMHTADAVGVAKEANVDDKGLFLTSKIVDDDCWKKILEGVYKGYSIGGRKLNKSGNTITEIEMVEISVVDRPANPECKFDVHKSAGAAPAFLTQLPKPEKVTKNLSKALTSLSQVAEFLTKDGPSAAHDGFSLPAKPKVEKADEKCAAHGMVDCKVCKEAAAGKPTTTGDDIGVDAGATEDTPTTKRDVSRKERKALARQGKALPGGGFPIKNKQDLMNARLAVGRAKNPGAARALIRRRARELGVELPPNWSKKLAKGLIAEAEVFRLALGSAGSSFLTLSAGGDQGAKGAGLGHGLSSARGGAPEEDDTTLREIFSKPERKILKRMGIAGSLSYCFDSLRDAQRSLLMEAQREGGDMKDKALAEKLGSLAQGLAAVIGQKAEHEGQEALDLTDADDQGFLNLGQGVPEMTGKAVTNDSGGLNFDTSEISDPVAKGLLDLLKRASVPTRSARMQMARGDLKKARTAMKDLEKSIIDAHRMHKAAYLAKAAKKPDGDGEFDHQGAMEKLQKAFSNLQTVKTMTKSAGGQLKKAMSRSGQRGQEVSDGTSDYVVPAGVKDLTPGQIDTAGGSSEPFVHGMETPFPGKSAKSKLTKFIKNGQIPVEIAEMLAENAALEGQVEALGKLPAAPVFGKRPAAFDVAKIVGGTEDGRATIMKGVDPADLTKDETSNSRAIAKMIGNMIVSGQGKSVFETDFKGTGGLG